MTCNKSTCICLMETWSTVYLIITIFTSFVRVIFTARNELPKIFSDLSSRTSSVTHLNSEVLCVSVTHAIWILLKPQTQRLGWVFYFFYLKKQIRGSCFTMSGVVFFFFSSMLPLHPVCVCVCLWQRTEKMTQSRQRQRKIQRDKLTLAEQIVGSESETF